MDDHREPGAASNQNQSWNQDKDHDRTSRPIPHPPQDPALLSRRSTLRAAGGALTALVTAPLLASALPPRDALATQGGVPSDDPDDYDGYDAPCPEPDPDAPTKRQMRAVWIASVVNIDWPSSQGLDIAAQQAELTRLYDEAVSHGLNAVFVQIRPTADAFWPSPYEPWSEWLTGRQGGDPGYDPLQFAIAEAHRRNLEFHGWFNPYRVSMHDEIKRLVESHPARQHPEWIFEYGKRFYYNPGIPEVREFVQDAMMHAVEHYDMDGVHFDDYFYPYPVANRELPDAETYARYGNRFDDIGDWRRHNVDMLVKEMSERIKETKPHVRFGISPFGIWRNASSDPDGSDTSGFESYDGIYADSRKWVREGWLDYINPQVYWEIGLKVADYAKLVPWWAGVVEGTDTHLYIGQAAYKVGNEGAWEDMRELSRHLAFNRDYPRVNGDVYFSAIRMRTTAAEAMQIVAEEHYAYPALIPVSEGLGGSAPPAPVIVLARRTEGGAKLTIRRRHRSDPTYYAVYRFAGEPEYAEPPVCDMEDPRNMAGTVRSDGELTTFVDTEVAEGPHTYYVTALDRLHHESEPSRGRYIA
ncbi:family 10 glycosylhydrolase [Nocardiopsis rhodophaea]|uniref:Family 10 glycosylhydrolase n=1 Tax=Nocardiopsis rhodophaea TaxID=280238 RepID=A0ABN2S3N2_9ACTN